MGKIMKRTVLKFGGSSVETLDKMKFVADRIISRVSDREQIIVVVSAMGKSTNNLLDLARKAALHPNKREVDLLISTGEQVSIAILSMILNDKGYKAIALTGFQAGIKTEGGHTNSKIVDIDTTNILKHLNEGKIVVVAGFQGVNQNKDVTTIGREGSDTSAVALAQYLECGCEIYTDVEGVYTIDPRVYAKAKKLDVISYDELMEMSNLGAKVIATSAIKLARCYQVPLYIASTYKQMIGTYVKRDNQGKMVGIAIANKGILIKGKNIDTINYEEMFDIIKDNGVKVDLISRNKNELIFTMVGDDTAILDETLDIIQIKYPNLITSYDKEVTKVSLIGSDINLDMINDLKETLIHNNFSVFYEVISKLRYSIIINPNQVQEVVLVIAKTFNL
jgi:aspartate kinase